MPENSLVLLTPDELESMPPIVEVDVENRNPDIMRKYLVEYSQFCMDHNGVGLSAIQVNKCESFFVFMDDYETKKFSLIINPIYYPNGSRYQVDEICLSYPGEVYRLKRYRSIKVQYWTLLEGLYVFRHHTMKGENALIFQHETDHCHNISIRQKGKK